jgi:hypothetical protein
MLLGASVVDTFLLLARPSCGEEEEEDGRKAVDDDKCRNRVNPEVLRRETRSNRMASMMVMPLVRLLLLLLLEKKKDLGRDLRCGLFGMIR